jgi:hypothetical protein
MAVDFEYLKLDEVNPEVPPIPPGDYNLRVVGAERKTFEYKKDRPEAGVAAGDVGSYIKLTVAIVDDPDQTGRRIYASLFPSEKAARALRILQDATGIPQAGSLDEWLNSLVTERASFAAPVFTGSDREGKLTNEVRFTAAKPSA